MSKPWTHLLRRYGAEISAPSRSDIESAIAEIFDESLPGMTERDYAEHGATSIRHGFDDGPMYELELDRSGKVTLEQWADQDYETEVSPAATLHGLSAVHASELFDLLAIGDIDAVRAKFSAST